jgi:hypothetical protein
LAGELLAKKYGPELVIKLADLAGAKMYSKRGRPSKAVIPPTASESSTQMSGKKA